MNWPAWPDMPAWILPAAAGLVAGVLLAVAGTRLARRGRKRTNLTALRNDVADLAGQLEDFARRIDGRVDDRLDRLQALLAEADKKQQELRRLTEAAGQPGGKLAGASGGASGQVLALASQGLDSVEIARRLKMDVGEVELMINLHRSSVSSRL
ncbi:MAG: hypothetical protein ABSH10_01545 [Phycisphaerae bacterium]|jgi:hypothetical protein